MCTDAQGKIEVGAVCSKSQSNISEDFTCLLITHIKYNTNNFT